MILGQLIQTGRRFCECRSNDFIPKSEDTVVVIAYTIHDQFVAHSFDKNLFDIMGAIKTWLFRSEAVGYLTIRRKCHGSQCEFPAPIGRIPMDHVTLTAATQTDFKVVSFFLERIDGMNANRLVPTSNTYHEESNNLFRFSSPKQTPRSFDFFPEFAEFVS